MKEKYIFSILLIFGLILGFAYFSSQSNIEKQPSFEKMSMKTKINHLMENNSYYNAFIDSEKLTVIEEKGSKTEYKLGDEFYVSIAPYISSTHT